jgi:hypothetical protein
MDKKDFAHYLTTDTSRKCRPTDYAFEKDEYKKTPAFYWLSSPSDDGLNGKAYHVNPHGMILGSGKIVYSQGISFGAIGLDVEYSCGVRPAVWVKTKL